MLAPTPSAVVLALLAGLATMLLVHAQPLGRPRPDAAAWLQRHDPDWRARQQALGRPLPGPASAEGAAPAVRGVRRRTAAAARLLLRLLDRLGVRDLARLERRLALLAPTCTLEDMVGQLVLCWGLGTIIGLEAGLGLAHAGLMPGIAPVAAAALLGGLAAAGGRAGDLRRRWRRLAGQVTAELEALLTLATLGLASGLGVEEALAQAAAAGQGILAAEVQGLREQVRLGGRALVTAAERLAARFDLGPLWELAGALAAAEARGMPLAGALTAQAAALQQASRLRLLEQGERAKLQVLLPLALGLLPPLLLLVLVPALVPLLAQLQAP